MTVKSLQQCVQYLRCVERRLKKFQAVRGHGVERGEADEVLLTAGEIVARIAERMEEIGSETRRNYTL